METTKPIDKKRRQVEEQIFYNLMQIVKTYPQYTVSEHLVHVMRRKGDIEEAYFWSEEKLLKRFEHYREELDNELTITLDSE